MIVRRGGAGDVPFLRDMVAHAHYWRVATATPDDPPLAHYVRGWGRKGDAAVIAIDEHLPIGAAWYRLFPADDPGYGFVDEQTPELTMAIVPSKRGRGAGRLLLDALLQRARDDGFGALSLSVERSNAGAIRLYESFGFRPVQEIGNAITMRADLDGADGG